MKEKIAELQQNIGDNLTIEKQIVEIKKKLDDEKEKLNKLNSELTGLEKEYKKTKQSIVFLNLVIESHLSEENKSFEDNSEEIDITNNHSLLFNTYNNRKKNIEQIKKLTEKVQCLQKSIYAATDNVLLEEYAMEMISIIKKINANEKDLEKNIFQEADFDTLNEINNNANQEFMQLENLTNGKINLIEDEVEKNQMSIDDVKIEINKLSSYMIQNNNNQQQQCAHFGCFKFKK